MSVALLELGFVLAPLGLGFVLAPLELGLGLALLMVSPFGLGLLLAPLGLGLLVLASLVFGFVLASLGLGFVLASLGLASLVLASFVPDRLVSFRGRFNDCPNVTLVVGLTFGGPGLYRAIIQLFASSGELASPKACRRPIQQSPAGENSTPSRHLWTPLNELACLFSLVRVQAATQRLKSSSVNALRFVSSNL